MGDSRTHAGADSPPPTTIHSMVDDAPPTVTVTFRGHTHKLRLPLTEHRLSNAQLYTAVAELLPAILHLKLVHAGKIVRNNDDDCSVSAHDIVFASGTTSEELKQLEATRAAPPRIRDDLAMTESADFDSKGDDYPTRPIAMGVGPSQTGFGSITTIAGLLDEDSARNLLHRLAGDIGVQAVMHQRRFFVPRLTEMYPDGKVGVDPVCVLGLNKNSGQEIMLRIRTDDMLGFRKYAIILKTLYHELAHNLLSEHTGEFYGLVSELERQGAAADWTRQEGRTTGDGAVFRRPAGAPGGSVRGRGGGGRRLGGQTAPASSASDTVEAREQRALAAVQRSRDGSDRAPAVVQQSSSSSSADQTVSPPVIEHVVTIDHASHVIEHDGDDDDERSGRGYHSNSDYGDSCHDCETHVPRTIGNSSCSNNADVVSDSTMVAQSSPSARSTTSPLPGGDNDTASLRGGGDLQVPTPVAATEPCVSAPASMTTPPSAAAAQPTDVSLAATADGGADNGALDAQQAAVQARIMRINGYITTLSSDARSAAGEAGVRVSLETLLDIIERALKSLSDGVAVHRRVRPSNAVFAEKTRRSRAAVELLLAAGFQVQRGEGDGGQDSASAEWLALPAQNSRVDIVALWLARDLLKDALQAQN